MVAYNNPAIHDAIIAGAGANNSWMVDAVSADYAGEANALETLAVNIDSRIAPISGGASLSHVELISGLVAEVMSGRSLTSTTAADYNTVAAAIAAAFTQFSSKLVGAPFIPGVNQPFASIGTFSQSSITSVNWVGVAYGNGKYVAIGNGSTSVATSTDGIVWSVAASISANSWRSIAYGQSATIPNGLFVAIGDTAGVGNKISTSPDGITWTARTAPADINYQSVCFGNGIFVAVANTGTGNRVMTSPDGITWTTQVSAADNAWTSVVYGNGKFVAGSNTAGAGNRVMTGTSDGVTWTARNATDQHILGLAFGYLGNNSAKPLFVAGGNTAGAGNHIQTSTDGVTWGAKTSPVDGNVQCVVFVNGVFLCIGASATVGLKMVSSIDGDNWQVRTAPADLTYFCGAYGNNTVVALAQGSGVGVAVAHGQ
jgi:hypothetical protein